MSMKLEALNTALVTAFDAAKGALSEIPAIDDRLVAAAEAVESVAAASVGIKRATPDRKVALNLFTEGFAEAVKASAEDPNQAWLYPGVYIIYSEAGKGKSTFLRAVAERARHSLVTPQAGPVPLNEPGRPGVPLGYKSIRSAVDSLGGINGVAVHDGYSALITLSGGAAASGGYPRELPTAILAFNQLAVATGNVILASINPFFEWGSAGHRLFHQMVEGSCQGVLAIEGSDLKKAESGKGSELLIRMTASLRPFARGDNALSLSFTVPLPKEA